MGIPQVKNSVVILGAGISGLLAAWALYRLGQDCIIIDKGPRDALPRIVPGCVYLHESCDLPEPALKSAYLWTQVLPSPTTQALSPGDRYHIKIWGTKRPRVPNSVDKIPLIEDGYWSQIFSMNHALVWLYRRFRMSIVVRDVTLPDVEELIRQGKRVISTIPIGLFAPDAPRISKETWIVQVPESPRRPEDGLPAIPGAVASTLYNLDLSTAWYRASSMFGFTAIEFIIDPGGTAAKFRKIISGPDAKEIEARYSGRLILAGRWARWERGLLANHTYHQVRGAFNDV